MVIHKVYYAAFAALWLAAATGAYAIYGISFPPSPAREEAFIDYLSSPSPASADILSRYDAARYEAIFQAQQKADWAAADAAIAKLDNRLLVGHVLAARYLDSRYSPAARELADWLGLYSDHPQASRIYTLAVANFPSLKNKIAALESLPSLGGYGDDNGLAALHGDESHYTKHWQDGLKAWRAGRTQEAADLFSSAARQDKLSPWNESAAAYWAWRAWRSLGEQERADHFLRQAALEPRSFYGILARKQLKEQLYLDTESSALTDNDLLAMVGNQSIRRARALAAIGVSELAEQELRAIFPQADEDEKPRLLALAHELNLASVEISMAKQLSRDGHELDFARYPVPAWRPLGGFKIDPSLLYALMRQESGFRPSAVSAGGALGLMQLMPRTAMLMQKQMPDHYRGAAAEPALNMTLGQNYIRGLLVSEQVEGNLFYLLAAYNAGPGRLEEWKERLGTDDPLLFIESIPYPQTRHYITQVMANYWIYSEMAGTSNNSTLALLQGKWPAYQPPMPVAERLLPEHNG